MGRPAKYKSPKELETAIQKYLDSCKDEYATNAAGEVLLTTKGAPVVTHNPPTVTGLAHAVGFASRQALINYEGYSQEFYDTIKRAKLYIESRIEQGGLTGRLNASCTIFNLKNNYGWKDTQTVDDISGNKPATFEIKFIKGDK